MSSEQPLLVMSLLSSPTGHLTNLSTAPDNSEPRDDDTTLHRIALFPAAASWTREGVQGFARIINHSSEAGAVTIEAIDDEGEEYGPVTLDIQAGETVHFNSLDLESGNPDKGLTQGTGAGTGDWRLELGSHLALEVLAYIRTQDGFLTSMHDVVPETADEHRVVIFNPGRNVNQVSRLRIINPSEQDVEVRIEGIDGKGLLGESAVLVSVGSGAARTLSSQELEVGGCTGPDRCPWHRLRKVAAHGDLGPACPDAEPAVESDRAPHQPFHRRSAGPARHADERCAHRSLGAWRGNDPPSRLRHQRPRCVRLRVPRHLAAKKVRVARTAYLRIRRPGCFRFVGGKCNGGRRCDALMHASSFAVRAASSGNREVGSTATMQASNSKRHDSTTRPVASGRKRLYRRPPQVRLNWERFDRVYQRYALPQPRVVDRHCRGSARHFKSEQMEMKKLSRRILVPALTALWILTGCGGLSGGGDTIPVPHPRTHTTSTPPEEPGKEPQGPVDPTDPKQAAYEAEYARQWGLERVNAKAMHERGGTGRGVQIGIIDSDANPDHRELEGKYDVLDHAPLPPRGSGHGGAVAAVMVAKRDGHGMHGVAYEATLVAYEVRGGTGFSGLRWLNGQEVKLTNVSMGVVDSITEAVRNGTSVAITSPDAPWRIEARKYVESGGVLVYSAGNEGKADPSANSGAPYVAPGLEAGWLAVVGVGTNGTIYSSSNRCGVARDWCLAAPGASIYTITGTTEYGHAWGTSFAAPHVTGGIAGLKSMFPNLTFQCLRKRVLHTADRSGVYANASIYGKGLLDLDTASRPVDGTNFISGPDDDGVVYGTSSAVILVGNGYAGAAHEHDLLVFDGFQRAPFTVNLGSFVTERRGLVSLQDLELDQEQRPRPVALEEYRMGVQAFAGGKLGQRLGLGAGTTHANYLLPANSIGTTVRMNLGEGVFELAGATTPERKATTHTAGMQGWMPRNVLAATFVPQKGNASFGASFATGLGQPGGMKSGGALRTEGRALDVGYLRTIRLGDSAWGSIAGRLARLTSTNRAGLVNSEDSWIAGWTSKLTFELGTRTWLSTKVELQRSLAKPGTWFRAAQTIDENGNHLAPERAAGRRVDERHRPGKRAARARDVRSVAPRCGSCRSAGRERDDGRDRWRALRGPILDQGGDESRVRALELGLKGGWESFPRVGRGISSRHGATQGRSALRVGPGVRSRGSTVRR